MGSQAPHLQDVWHGWSEPAPETRGHATKGHDGRVPSSFALQRTVSRVTGCARRRTVRAMRPAAERGRYAVLFSSGIRSRLMVRQLILAASVMGTWPGVLAAQTRGMDSLAVLHVVQQHEEYMGSLQADRQGAIYAPDAVWINAFGRRIAGRDSIVAFLRELYRDPGYRESRVTREKPAEVIFVRSDVAIVHEFHQRDGQRMADGSVIARRIHTTFVLSKEDGRWLIKYQHIADERPRSQ
jgi:uncharacterized protein (TIGR02246 family)